MIKLYPVLVSNSVSKNIIPGILKSVERFALIYKLDDLARSARKDAGISLRKVGKKVVMKESENDEEIAAFLANQILHEQFNPMDGRFRGPTGSKKKKKEKSFKGEQPSAYSKDVYYAQQRKEATEKERGKYRGQRLEQPPRTLSPKEKDLWYRWNRERDEERMEIAKGRGKRTGSRFERPPRNLKGKELDLWYRWRDMQDEEEKAAAKERGRMRYTPADATIAIGQMDMRSIMLEPTWMKIDRVTKYGQKFTSVLGVKAVSVPVRSDATLAQLLTFDKNVGRLMHMVMKVGRQVTGILYRLYSRTIQRLVNPDPEAISGDPYKDIVLKRTILRDAHVDDVFLVLNQADLDDEFAIDAKGIRKLMSLGWQSFCIADDVNRRLTFCMKEFKGMCNMLPYTMVYQSLDQSKVFEDLEDVRRSSTSLFKKRLPMKRVFAESLAHQKLEEFGADLFTRPSQTEIEYLNELSYIDENFASVAKKIISSPKQFFTRALKGTTRTPTVTVERALKVAKKVDPQFPKAFALAKRVLKNSIKIEGLNENHLNWAAMTVAIRAKATPGKKDLLTKTRDVLMTVIPMFRRALRKVKQTTLNIPPQHRVEAVFGLTTVFLLATGLGFFYTWSMVGALKLKAKTPEIMDSTKEITDTFGSFVTSIFAKLKGFFEAASYTEPKDLVTFWKKMFTDSETRKSVTDTAAEYKEQIGNALKDTFKEGGSIDNLNTELKNQYDFSLGEAGILMVLSLIGIVGVIRLIRPRK